MKTRIYEHFPDCAKEIRKMVFMNEQGFQNEFDGIDNIAIHIVLFTENEKTIATCRVFQNPISKEYTLGRVAVLKEYRGKNIGSLIVKEAEKYIQEKEGKFIVLHAQCRVAEFYRKLGFTEFGTIENDEGCPHIWMRKNI